nr:ECF transporter S component [uncultured Butyrivibrio sp.]
MKKDLFGSKQIAYTAVLLAICIVSQIFKNLSVFITGPIINACIVIAVLTSGLVWGIILSVITPVTAYFIAASPVMMAVPGIIPLIMAGNAVLAIATNFLLKKDIKNGKGLRDIKSYVKAVICAACKGLFMGLTISLWLLPTFIPAESPLMKKLPVFQTTFSVTQFVTACIGFVYAFIIWAVLSKRLGRDNLYKEA